MAFRPLYDNPPAKFRHAFFAAHELLDKVAAIRTATSAALDNGTNFNWTGADEALALLEQSAARQVYEIVGTLKATRQNVFKCDAGMGPTACQLVLDLTCKTRRGLWRVQHAVQNNLPLPKATELDLAPISQEDCELLVNEMELEVSRASEAEKSHFEADSINPGAAQDVNHPDAVALTKDHVTVLKVLDENRPLAVLQDEIVLKSRLDKRTVTRALKHLRESGCVDKPFGPRKGFALTPQGIGLAGRFSL